MLKLAYVAKLPQQSPLADLLPKCSQPLKLGRIDVMRKRMGRKVEVNELSLLESAFNFFNSSRYGIRCRGSESTAEKRKDYVRVVNAL